MRKRVILLFLAIFGVALSAPAFAQRVNPAAEAKWQRFLAKHPGVQAGMVNNPNYLANHPGVATWLRDHPDVSMYARERGQIGGWDRSNQWHDRSWWYNNDPGWVRDNHPEWSNDGDWDDQHHWHDRDWWVQNHRDWVQDHHPGWYKHWEKHHDGDEEHDNGLYGENPGHGHGHGHHED